MLTTKIKVEMLKVKMLRKYGDFGTKSLLY